jgi:hypothetical protein
MNLGEAVILDAEKTASRKGAKHAKVAKQRKDFGFAFLCALATLRELFGFFHTFLRRALRYFAPTGRG